MSEQIEVETQPEETGTDDLRSALVELKNASETSARNGLMDEFTAAIRDLAKRSDTPAQTKVRTAVAISQDQPVESEIPAGYLAPVPVGAVPYGAGARTQLASISDFRRQRIPEWQRAFRTPEGDLLVARYMRALVSGDTVELRAMAEDDRRVRAIMARAGDLVIGDSSAGAPFDGSVGQLVPLPMANYIHNALYRLARMRLHARLHTGSNIRIPKQSAIAASTWVGESTVFVAGEGAVADSLHLALKKLTNIARLSNEAIADTLGLVMWLIEDVGGEMAEREDSTLYSTGTGTDQPNGFELADTIVATPASNPLFSVPLAEQSVDQTTPGNLLIDNLRSLFFRLGEKERSNAIWSGNDQVMETLSSLSDASERPFFQNRNDPVNLVGDAPSGATIGTIFGRPVVNLPGKLGTDPLLPDETENRLYLSNMSRSYAILEGPGVEVKASEEAGDAFENDETLYRFKRRVDGGVFGNGITGRHQYAFISGIILNGTP